MITNQSRLLTLVLASVLSSTLMFCSEQEGILVENSSDKTGNTSNHTTSGSEIAYSETFEGSNPFSTAESMNVGNWDYALQFVTSPVFQGAKCSRFEITADQPLVESGFRSEVAVVNASQDTHLGKENWYSFAVYFPGEGYEFDSTAEIITQWNQNNTASTLIRTESDNLYLQSSNTPGTSQDFLIGTVVKNQWHSIVIHITHSHYSDGLVEVWYDGVKKVSHAGGNMYDDVLPEWRVGLYKPAFETGASEVTRRIIYYDNVRVGTSNATYTEMVPSNDH